MNKKQVLSQNAALFAEIERTATETQAMRLRLEEQREKLELTELGLQIQRQNCQDIREQVDERMRDGVSDEEFEVFIRVLWKMKANLNTEEPCKCGCCTESI